MMLVVRLLFLVLLMTVTLLTVSSQSSLIQDFRWPTLFGLLMAAIAVGTIVIVVDTMTPNKRLSSVVAAYIGICVGLIGAVAFGALIDVITSAWELEDGQSKIYLSLGKVIFGIVLCYFSVSIVLTTKDDFRLVLPYVEFSREVRGIRPLLIDTSTLIDGRINDLGHADFLDAPLLVPQFVLDELQMLADSSDKLKRERGRRGLDLVAKLQQNPFLDITIDDPRVEGLSVDSMLLELARRDDMRILTTDMNLKKVAQIKGIAVLNINDLAAALKASLVPGELFSIELAKIGENPDQAVGYLPDGTMVVVQEAATHVGQTVDIEVTNMLNTAAGRMVFAKLAETNDKRDLHTAAVNQPREERTPNDASQRRGSQNPRRSS